MARLKSRRLLNGKRDNYCKANAIEYIRDAIIVKYIGVSKCIVNILSDKNLQLIKKYILK